MVTRCCTLPLPSVAQTRLNSVQQLCGAGATTDVRDTSTLRAWLEARADMASHLSQLGSAMGAGDPPDEVVGIATTVATGSAQPLGDTPMQLAIKRASHACLEVMLKLGANPNQDVTVSAGSEHPLVALPWAVARVCPVLIRKCRQPRGMRLGVHNVTWLREA